MDAQLLADQQKLIYISSVRILDIVWKTCWLRWMIGTDGESRKSALQARLDDNNDEEICFEFSFPSFKNPVCLSSNNRYAKFFSLYNYPLNLL